MTDYDGNVLRTAFFLAVAVFVLGVASRCAALEQCKLKEEQRQVVREGGVVVRYDLHPEYFHCLLVEYKAARNLQGQVANLEEQNTMLKRDIASARMHLQLEERATGRAVEALELYRSESESSVLDSPLLWFAFGVAATAGVVVAVGVATK